MLVFCEECHDTVDYTVKSEKKVSNIKGKSIEYMGKEAYCCDCGKEVFVAEVRDYNLEALDMAFRQSERLITVAEIESLLEKYDIGKRPLSLLLGWGETTVTRYLNGDIPTKQYSDILMSLLNNHQYMKEMLEKNKEKISDHAYDSVKKVLETLDKEANETAYTAECDEKIDEVVKYLLNKCVDITPLALQKLLYYAQAFYKVFNGDYLFANNCEAWVHGPVYRNIYYKYKNHGYNPIEEPFNLENANIIELEKELLDSIINNFGCYSGKILEKMTHIETPWRITRKGLTDNQGSDRVIEKDLINRYFSDIKQKYQMLNIWDIRDYSNDLFRKVCD